MYIPSVRYLFLHMTLSYCPVSFHFYPQNSNISCRTGLVVINSLRLCFSGNILISLSLLKVTFARYRIPGCQFLSFSTLNISVHCLLAGLQDFWWGICRQTYWGSLVRMWCVVSMAAFTILSLSFNSLITISLGVAFL